MNPEDEDDLSWLVDEETPRPRGGVTLDEVRITGSADGDDSELAEAERAEAARARGFDTVEDVVASRRRKGNAMTAAEAPTAFDTIGGAILDPTAVAGTPDAARATARAARGRRDLTTSIGDTFEDVVEPLVPDALEATGTAGATGSAMGATMGFGDELTGIASELGNAPDVMAGREEFGAAYEPARDRVRADARREREASPMAYGAGELVGALATAPLTPSLTGARAATTAGRIGNAAIEGAALGAAAGFGSSEHEFAPDGDLDGLARDTLAGGAGGALFGAGGGALGEVAGAGVDALRRSAARADELRAIAPAGGLAAGADALRSAGRDVPDVANRLRGMGLGGVNTSEGMSAAASAARRRFGSEIGATRGVLEEAGEVPVASLRAAMERHADELARTTSGAPLADAVRARAERLADTMGADSVPYSRAIEELQGLGRDLNWTDRAGRPITAGTEAGRRLYGAVRGELDDFARPVLGDEGLAAYRNSRANERVAIAADEAAREAANRVGSNRGTSLTDVVLAAGAGGGFGGATGSPLAGVLTGGAAALANRSYRLREPSLRAATAEGVRSILESHAAASLGTYAPVLRNALARGADVFAGIHAALMNRDPEYAATVEEATAAPPEPPPADDAWLDRFVEEPTAPADDDWLSRFEEESP
jgi:hypothetical protein